MLLFEAFSTTPPLTIQQGHDGNNASLSNAPFGVSSQILARISFSKFGENVESEVLFLGLKLIEWEAVYVNDEGHVSLLYG
jgi:hypothetical protein